MLTQKPIPENATIRGGSLINRFGSKLQKIVEPLCEMRENFRLTHDEQKVIARDIRITNNVAGFTELPIRHKSKLWLDIIEQSNFIVSEGTANMLSPRLTIMNKIGLGAWKAFSIGTECTCCWGLRVVVVIVLSFLIGFLTRSYL